MAKKEWIGWLKCNILEIIILILVLVLVVKAFYVPAVDEVNKVPSLATVEESATLGEPVAAEVPPETPVVETLTETPVAAEGSTVPS